MAVEKPKGDHKKTGQKPPPPKPVADVKWAGLPGRASPDRSAGDPHPMRKGLKDTLN